MPMRARLDAALLTRPPRLLHTLLRGCEWTAPAATPSGQPVVYLTFDDGPVPDETPWVLAQLAEFQAKATFFCVGENLARYPEIARAALAAGHRLGNHTHQHRSAWATPRAAYLEDIAVCQSHISELLNMGTEMPAAISLPLFRPPYGRLTWPLLPLLQADFRVIMWSVLTRDYDPALHPEDCLRFALQAVRAGDVVVFHDSRKAGPRLRYVLPRLLAHLAAQGFAFATL
ncbi:polysaccharide deacetylase family protein [Hymenobacter glaciei]|uniref:Polysaccharide deacetylase family protein n=1 Tax=Hymenobacter glaciei TaxID=877209 RepID=A0ABP7U3N0_9BACT